MTSSRGGVNPPVMMTQGKSCPSASLQRVGTRRGIEALEEADFALAEDQNPSGLQVFVKPGQREAGLLDVGTGDEAVEAVAAGQQVEREAQAPRVDSAGGHRR